MTKEEAFRNGASIMQARIVAWFLMQNDIPMILRMTLAPQIYAISLPNYEEPETMELRKG